MNWGDLTPGNALQDHEFTYVLVAKEPKLAVEGYHYTWLILETGQVHVSKYGPITLEREIPRPWKVFK